jgi:hypothetical protein
MEVLIEKLEPLIARLIVLKNLESYIQESIYYRSHSGVFLNKKYTIWSFDCESKKTKVL